MPTIDQFKEQETPPTPLFIFDCMLASGVTVRWSTHAVTVGGNAYPARLLKHNLSALVASSDQGVDGAQKITVTLANADSYFSQLERETGFRGARVTIRFLFYDLTANAAVSEERVMFLGTGSMAEEITESAFRVSFTNRLNMQRIILPEVRIQRQCPWSFPSTAAQRAEALNGGPKGKYSALNRCGYSPDQAGGVGNLNGTVPFTSCDYTRTSCVARGMFDTDSASQETRNFGGIEFVPAQIQVRSFGESGTHLSSLIDNQARYNDFVPLAYGSAWYQPPTTFARNDGNLTHLEVLLGMGRIENVVTVVVNGVEIPQGQSGMNMTATGWFNLVTPGARNGAFNADFVDSSGQPLGDPYGSMALLSVVVPNQVSSAQSLPKVDILLMGLMLERFDIAGVSLGETFTNSPPWVLLDVLRRSGWLTTEIDLPSFASAATYCDEQIPTTDLYGNAISTPRFQCNLVLAKRWSAAEVVKGIRNGSGLMLGYGQSGLLRLRVENTLALQQPALPDGSNSTDALDGGWPAYEFSDGSAAFSGIVRKANGDPAIRLWAPNGADVANRLTVEFQDEFNQYRQDSLGLVDVDDAQLTGREVTASFAAAGLPNFDQAARMMQLHLDKALSGSTFVEFETTVKGIGLTPGDLISVTYLKEGLERQPLRVVQLAPGRNFESVLVTAQWHDDAWYTTGDASTVGGRSPNGAGLGLPRPLVGSVIDSNGIGQFGITETVIQGAVGSAVLLSVAFMPPALPKATGAAIPLVSLSPTIPMAGGTLAGNQNLYYALTALDTSGAESGLSFTVRATIPAGTDTNEVTLTGLSFSPETSAFNVYRGLNPSQLLRIAASVAVSTSYTDAGETPQLAGPPDSNYDHANFSWRRELQPEAGATVFTGTAVGNDTLGMATDEFVGKSARITRGTGATQERVVTANDASTLTVAPPWTVTPDTTSYFVVADSAWNFGAVGTSSPVQMQVPNWGGQSVEISGRSANVLNQESRYELNPLTRWQIGSGGAGGDTGFPPLPNFVLTPAAQGTIDLSGITFPTQANTLTIAAGSLTLFYYDELDGPSSVSLTAGITATDTTVTLNVVSAAVPDDFIQIDAEIFQVQSLQSGGLELTVTRGVHGSAAEAHGNAATVYLLERTTVIVAFVSAFFLSPASANYKYSIFLPDVRVVAAEFYVSNMFGTSPVMHVPYSATTDGGLRTLSGGQIALQVDGYLAVQTDATPPFVMDEAHIPRDIFATLREAPAGGAVILLIRHDSAAYSTLTIASGDTVSNTVNGLGLPALAAGSQIHLDVVNVPGAANTLPGRDLTVTIRL
ncbi:MAG: phage tail protein [Acidobacteriota bacterium]